MGDVRVDLAETAADEPPVVQPVRRSGTPLLWALGAAAAAAVLGMAAGQWRTVASPSVHAPEPTRVVRLTNGPHREFVPAISPDGKWVAYVSVGTGQPQRTDVWVRFIGGGDPINLTASADLDITTNSGIGGLDIAPEGNRIAVMAKPRSSTGSFATWEIPAPLPGQPRKLLDDGMLGARWSPDGTRDRLHPGRGLGRRRALGGGCRWRQPPRDYRSQRRHSHSLAGLVPGSAHLLQPDALDDCEPGPVGRLPRER